jgi:acetyl-CoA acetyltransferase
MTLIGERRAVVSGVGRSQVGRRLGRTALDLTVDACLAAILDAGLVPADVDGLSTYPGGADGPSGGALQDALGLKVDWHNGGAEGPAQLAAVVNACMAVATGLARHVLVFHTVIAASSTGPSRAVPGGRRRVSGEMQWLHPFNATSPANWHALEAQWHFHRYGTTREQLGWIPITLRANAGRNPDAIYREPMSMDDYLEARMISSPLCLYDCDVPVDGSTAFIISAAEYAQDAPAGAAHVHALGTARHDRPLWDQWDDSSGGTRDAARQLWSRADLSPSDVDVAELYDGFSIMLLTWLEELGFCQPGEGGPFVDGGERIGCKGVLPINTDGGQLSAGRLHGFGLVREAVLQLRGVCGDRQVPEAEVALVSNGSGHISGCMLLTRSR